MGERIFTSRRRDAGSPACGGGSGSAAWRVCVCARSRRCSNWRGASNRSRPTWQASSGGSLRVVRNPSGSGRGRRQWRTNAKPHRVDRPSPEHPGRLVAVIDSPTTGKLDSRSQRPALQAAARARRRHRMRTHAARLSGMPATDHPISAASPAGRRACWPRALSTDSFNSPRVWRSERQLRISVW